MTEQQIDSDAVEVPQDSAAEATKRDMAENVGGGVDRDKLERGDFVFGDERAFPVVTPGDVSDAVSSWGRYKGSHSFEEFKRRLTALCKRKGQSFLAALPDSWKEREGEGRSLPLPYAVKALAETDDAYIIGGYGMLWGHEGQRDLSPWPNENKSKGEFFTPSTKGLDDLPVKVVTFEHDQETDPDGSPIRDILGRTLDEVDDRVGRWFRAQIEKSRQYAQYVLRLIEQGKLSVSSETASHWRQVADNGEIKRWRTAGYTLTTHPMEPRITGVEVLAKSFKSLDLDLPHEDEQTSGAAAGAAGEDADLKVAKTKAAIEIELAQLNLQEAQ